MNITHFQYTETLGELVKLLQRKKMRLQEYALKPNANKQAIEIQQEELNRFNAIVIELNHLGVEMQAETLEAYQKGFLAGEHRKDKKYPHRRETDKETARFNSKLQLEELMPHLF